MLYEEFIWNLLEGRMTDPRAVEERVKLLGLGLKKNIYVFVFDLREYDAGQYSASYMRDLLEQMISGGRAIVYSDHIVITASFSRAQDIFRTELINLGAFLKEYNIRCGISRRCTEPAELRLYYEQALDAMRVGTHMDGDRYIYPYGEYAVYHVAEACRTAGGQNILDKNIYGMRDTAIRGFWRSSPMTGNIRPISPTASARISGRSKISRTPPPPCICTATRWCTISGASGRSWTSASTITTPCSRLNYRSDSLNTKKSWSDGTNGTKSRSRIGKNTHPPAQKRYRGFAPMTPAKMLGNDRNA